MSKKKVYRAAVVGCGTIGANESIYSKSVRPGTHAGAYFNNTRTNLVALVDSDKQRLKEMSKFYPGVKLYSDLKRMLSENTLDIVSIATPTKFHPHHVDQVARHRMSVIFCEKPIAYDLAEARKMIAVCRRFGCQLFINHQRRFDPLLLKWSQQVRKGLIGKIYQADAYYYNGIINAGTHLIDLIRMFLGDPQAVAAVYNRQTTNLKKGPNVDGQIDFKQGLKVYLHSLSHNYGYFGLRLFGETGMINIDNLAFRVEFRKKIANKNFRGYYQLSERAIIEGGPRSFFAGTVQYLVDFLDGKVKASGTGEDALAALKILIRLKASAAKKGQSLSL